MTAHMDPVATPELDKQLAIIHSGKAGIVQDFIDWLDQHGMAICKISRERTYTAGGESVQHFEPIPDTPEQLMADHFGIDRNKIESERRALLAALRKMHEADEQAERQS